MKLHANARLSLIRRREMVEMVLEQNCSIAEAAVRAGVSARTTTKWLRRFELEGEPGLRDRSSAPHRIPHKTPADRVAAIERLRRLRMTGAQIAAALGMAFSTVSAVLKRIGLGKLSRLQAPEPPNRYERRHPGELLHIDIKKLGRIQGGPGARKTGKFPGYKGSGGGGWEYVHVCIDDATRLAYVEVLADQKAPTAAGFLRRAVAFYRRHAIHVARVMTDNGSCYIGKIHAAACLALGLRHLRTRPYRPRTNGKAERFIRTLIDGWAHGPTYTSNAQRIAALDGWLWHYNHHRPHGALAYKTPMHRLHALQQPA
jgi:transposase InsO family protein